MRLPACCCRRSNLSCKYRQTASSSLSRKDFRVVVCAMSPLSTSLPVGGNCGSRLFFGDRYRRSRISSWRTDILWSNGWKDSILQGATNEYLDRVLSITTFNGRLRRPDYKLLLSTAGNLSVESYHHRLQPNSKVVDARDVAVKVDATETTRMTLTFTSDQRLMLVV
jgi:hypothetical protein